MTNVTTFGQLAQTLTNMEEFALVFGATTDTLTFELPVEKHMPAIVWTGKDVFGRIGHTININKCSLTVTVVRGDTQEVAGFKCEGLYDWGNEKDKLLKQIWNFFTNTEYRFYSDEKQAFVPVKPQ